MNEREERVIAEITPEARRRARLRPDPHPQLQDRGDAPGPLAGGLLHRARLRGRDAGGRAGPIQVIARLRGSGGGKSMMFNGHIDIDPLSLGWRHDPWEPVVEGDRLYGAGVMNMKGGDAAMIAAAEAIRTSGDHPPGRHRHRAGRRRAARWRRHGPHAGARDLRTDAAIVPEPFGADAVVTTHAGVTEMAISTIGYSRHITDRTGAVDAIEQMMKAIPAIKATRFRPNTDSRAAGAAAAQRGRHHRRPRPRPRSQGTELHRRLLHRPRRRPLPAGSDRRDCRGGYPRLARCARSRRSDLPLRDRASPAGPLRRADGDHGADRHSPRSSRWSPAVLRHYREVVGRDPLDVGVSLPMSYAGNDTAHLWRAGIPCLLFGPSGGWDESPEEPDQYISISEMVTVAKVMALTALDICSQPRLTADDRTYTERKVRTCGAVIIASHDGLARWRRSATSRRGVETRLSEEDVTMRQRYVSQTDHAAFLERPHRPARAGESDWPRSASAIPALAPALPDLEPRRGGPGDGARRAGRRGGGRRLSGAEQPQLPAHRRPDLLRQHAAHAPLRADDPLQRARG